MPVKYPYGCTEKVYVVLSEVYIWKSVNSYNGIEENVVSRI